MRTEIVHQNMLKANLFGPCYECIHKMFFNVNVVDIIIIITLNLGLWQ